VKSHKQNTSLEQNLLQFFEEHLNKSYQFQDILSAFGYEASDAAIVKQALRHLVDQKEIQRLKGRRFTARFASYSTHLRSGIFEPGEFGYAFVRTDPEDFFIPPGSSGTALPGDTVKIEILAPRSRSGPNREARVIGILKRKKNEFIGEYYKTAGGGFVHTDHTFLKRHIFIPNGKERGAQNSERVAVKITLWDNEYADPYGEVENIIGLPGEKGVDVLSIARLAGIPQAFPKNVLEEAKTLIPITENNISDGRIDYRDTECFTIDPENAKDFDDAVSFQRLPDGNYRLGVYIADVSAYVLDGSIIDKEAAKRGTSVYLIDKVIPMLPPRLSEDLCSLRPDEDRPVYAVIMTCSPDGTVIDYEITEGIIRSKYRFSYEEAQIIIDGKKKSPFRNTLREMNRFSKILRKKRFETGGLDFYIPEVIFKLDEQGIPLSLSVKPILETHSLIEEFMLLANQTVARHKTVLERNYKTGLPFLYRVHDRPDKDDIRGFWRLAKSLGCPAAKGSPGSSHWFQNILDYFADKPEKVFIEVIALRSMMKAVYQTKNLGHFGLGFKEYTHFTSPIRRYPDLVIHRLLKRFTAGITPKEILSLKRRLGHTGRHSTDMEIRAMNTEREAIKLKQLEYMQDKVGEILNGIISGVTPFGFFVELKHILVEGLVHIRDLKDDFYVFDEDNYRLVGSRTGKKYILGNRVTVEVKKVNIRQGHLDFSIID
jgi:ribonuclease R